MLTVALSCCTRAAVPPHTPSAAPQQTSDDAVSRTDATPNRKRRVIIMVWDGLRPDSIDPQITPQLARLRDAQGVNFRDHHSVYPTFTMMNAAAFATGTRSWAHGFYGNTLYQPGPKGHNAKGAEVDYTQPVYSEDYAVLQTLDAYDREHGKALLQVQTLFELAHEHGLKTAVIGKSGPAFMQDYRQTGDSGVILDENVVFPRAFALDLQAAGFALPKNTVKHRYPDGSITLVAGNDDPSAAAHGAKITLDDGVTSDPRAHNGSPHNTRNAYMMRVLTDYVLPKLDPALALIWLRNPDSTEHTYGPGTPNVIDALRHQDQLLGQLLSSLRALGRLHSTDLLVVSDHGHSTVAAEPERFPLRALQGEPDGHAKVGEPAQQGYVVSGEVRTIDWLRRAGFAHAYDGMSCVLDPVLSGIAAHGRALHPTRTDAQCDEQPYSTPSYRVPEALPADAIIDATNGGSEYFYLPSHDPQLLRRLASALQQREAYGAIFVRELYGAVPGTLPLSSVGLEGPHSVSPPTPDLVVSFAWNADATSAAAPQTPGRELASALGNRGMHGAFSPRDVHNSLVAVGPHFRAGFGDETPSSNLDVAPTVAALLGFNMPQAEGRVLLEALSDAHERLTVEPFEEQTAPISLTQVCATDDLDCKHPGAAANYTIHLRGHTVTSADGNTRVRYLDEAEAQRVAPHPHR